MKIIAIDNYDRDYIPDTLIAESVNEHLGKDIVEFLNRKHGNGGDYYILVDDDYKLLTIEDIY